MFGQTKEEEVKTNPERGEGDGLPDLEVIKDEIEHPSGQHIGRTSSEFITVQEVGRREDNQSLQTIVKSTLEDFYTAIERLKTVTVEIDKVSIGAENWLKSNN